MGTSMPSVESLSISMLSHDQCFLRAQLFYQVVQPWHIADAGLEFKMDLGSGVNYARFPNTLDLNSPDNKEKLKVAVTSSTAIVEERSARGDSAAIQKRLASAATWGRAEELGYLLRSCYVTEADALPALAEAAMRGSAECVELLLQAGVSGCKPIPGSLSNKNALHIACENGQEECARAIIMNVADNDGVLEGARSICMVCRVGDNELTCFDLLRHRDFNGMARRLEALARSLEET